MKTLLVLLECASFALGLVGLANGQESLDLAAIVAPSYATMESEPLDIAEIVRPVAAGPVESLDLGAICEPAKPQPETVNVKTIPASPQVQVPTAKVDRLLDTLGGDVRYTVAGSTNPTRRQLVEHLLTGLHAGKWTEAELVYMTDEQLRQLHDRDHAAMAGKTKTVPTTAPQPAQQAGRWEWRQYCQGGRCVWRMVWVN